MELLRKSWQKPALSVRDDTIQQQRKQILSCSQSLIQPIFKKTENTFGAHNPVVSQARNVNNIVRNEPNTSHIHLKFSVSLTFALHYKASCVSIISRRDRERERSIKCQYLPASPPWEHLTSGGSQALCNVIVFVVKVVLLSVWKSGQQRQEGK